MLLTMPCCCVQQRLFVPGCSCSGCCWPCLAIAARGLLPARDDSTLADSTANPMCCWLPWLQGPCTLTRCRLLRRGPIVKPRRSNHLHRRSSSSSSSIRGQRQSSSRLAGWAACCLASGERGSRSAGLAAARAGGGWMPALGRNSRKTSQRSRGKQQPKDRQACSQLCARSASSLFFSGLPQAAAVP